MATSTPRCKTFQLSGAVVGQSGAAGTTYSDISIKNKSTKSCYLQGHPTGRFLANKSPIGAGSTYAAQGSTQAKVTLKPGKHAYVRLAVANASNWPSTCKPVRADAVLLTLPKTTAKLSVPLGKVRTNVCENKNDQQLGLSQFLTKRTTAH